MVDGTGMNLYELPIHELTFVAEALGSMEQSYLVRRLLIPLLSHEHAAVREGAVLGIKDHIDDAVRPLLETIAMYDSSHAVRLVASDALRLAKESTVINTEIKEVEGEYRAVPVRPSQIGQALANAIPADEKADEALGKLFQEYAPNSRRRPLIGWSVVKGLKRKQVIFLKKLLSKAFAR
jgi:hypothetical protein